MQNKNFNFQKLENHRKLANFKMHFSHVVYASQRPFLHHWKEKFMLSKIVYSKIASKPIVKAYFEISRCDFFFETEEVYCINHQNSITKIKTNLSRKKN